MVSKLGLGSVFCLAIGFAGSTAAEDWLVRSAHAECLAQNLDVYAQAEADPVVIFLEACPIADMEEAMASLQKNLTQPKLNQTETASGPAFDDIVVYSKSDLACLARAFPAPDGAAVYLPKTPNCPDG